MKFKGYGFVFCAKKNKTIVSFNKVDIYETHDQDEINTLLNNPNVEVVEGSDDIIAVKETPEEGEEKQLTNQEIKDLLDNAGIEYKKRATKAELEKLLEEIK